MPKRVRFKGELLVMREGLLVSQRHHGIDSRRAPRGNKARHEGNRTENDNGEHKGQRIARLRTQVR